MKTLAEIEQIILQQGAAIADIDQKVDDLVDESQDDLPPPEFGQPAQALPAVVVIRVNGLKWRIDQWTGTESDFLKIPEDGTTPPSYMTREQYDAIDFDSIPSDNSDDRLIFDIIRLSETCGPTYDASFFFKECNGAVMWRWDWSASSVLNGWIYCDGITGSDTVDMRGRTVYGIKSGDPVFGGPSLEVGSVDHGHDDHPNHFHHIRTGGGSKIDGSGGVYDEWTNEQVNILGDALVLNHSTATVVSPGILGVFVMRKRGYKH